MNKKNLALVIGLLLNSFIYSQTCNSIATYTPIATQYMNSDYNSENIAQVFTTSFSASNFDVTLELATCKSNGLCDAQLEIVTVNQGEPEWTNVIGSAVVPENQIYGWPSCQAGTFGSSTFSFNGVTLNTGVQYALVLKPAPGGGPGSSLAWRRSSTPTDPSNPYSGGDLWTYNLNSNNSMQNSNLDLQFNICDTSTCTNSIATYTPIATQYMNSDYNSENVAQVFTTSFSASNFDVTLELATCKSNGLCDAQLEIVTVNQGEPEWTNVIGSAVVPENQIYGWPSCQAGTFGSSTFSFNGVTLNTGVQYALVLKPAPGGGPGSSLAWRRSSTPTDPSNPYSGGDLWTYNLNSNNSMQNSNLDLQFNICDTSTLGVFDYDINNHLFIYPNPSNDFIMISGLKKSNQYIIYNTLGVETDSGNISDNEKINIQNFSNGMYFMILENGHVQKFIKR